MKDRENPECARIRESFAAGAAGPSEQSHLFLCADCRVETRLAAAWTAWKTIEPPLEVAPASVDAKFVRGVMELVSREKARRKTLRWRLAAAAALLFFFAAGASQRLASSTSAGEEDTYAQLTNADLVPELPE